MRRRSLGNKRKRHSGRFAASARLCGATQQLGGRDRRVIPRKRRTRQHIIADQSVNHLERFIIDEGHVVQRVEHDYGYDLILLTFDATGYAEPGYATLQIKACERLA